VAELTTAARCLVIELATVAGCLVIELATVAGCLVIELATVAGCPSHDRRSGVALNFTSLAWLPRRWSVYW
jgi:hypothetical protein